MIFELEYKKLRYYAACTGYWQLELGENYSSYDLEDVQKIFDTLSNSGIYYDEFLDILYPDDPPSRTGTDPFLSVLKKLDIDIPDNYQEALHGILNYHFFLILEGQNAPYNTMANIADEFGFIDEECETTVPKNELPKITWVITELAISCYWEHSRREPEWVFDDELLNRVLLVVIRAWLDEYGEAEDRTQ